MQAIVKSDSGETHGNVLFGLERTFSTGSKGFHGSGKVLINGKRYQANFTLVEIGSKPQKGE